MTQSAVNDQIPILSAVGSGTTTLSAFHAALALLGLEHYNLIRLSSSIPPHTSVDRTGRTAAPSGGWGDRLYCVYAQRFATAAGEQAWAGVGWVRRLDGRGGLFVEHSGPSEDVVTQAIRLSLADLTAGRPQDFTAPDWIVRGIVCTGRPVCSLVIAPFETAAWVGAR